MPHFQIRGSGTTVEAIGQVTTNNGAYYASFDRPAEAAKAIWAGASSPRKQGYEFPASEATRA